MPIVLQEKLIQWILLPVSRIVEKIPMAIRDTAFSLSVFVLILMQFIRGSGLYTGRFLFQFLIVYFLFGIMILTGLTSDIKPVPFSPVLFACWLGCTVFMLLTGILVNTSSLANATLWLVIFPIFYMVWGQREFDRIVPLVVRGVLLSFLIFTIVSIFFYPINAINYSSFFINRNRTGLYLVSVFVCLLGYIFSKQSFSVYVLIAEIISGFTAASIYYTNSRTSIIATALCFLASSLFYLYIYRKELRHILLCKILPIIAATIILLPNTIYIYQSGYSLASSIQTALEATPPPVTADPLSPGTTDVPILTPAVSEAPGTPTPAPPAAETLDAMKDYNEQRFDTAEKTLNAYTAGRVARWVAYSREISFLGNPPGKVLYDFNGKEITNSSHFTIIQFAYSYGAIAGLSMLLLNIFAGLASIRYAIKRRELKYCIFPFAVAIAYGAESVMEALGSAGTDCLSFLYFFSLIPLITRTGICLDTGSTAKEEERL